MHTNPTRPATTLPLRAPNINAIFRSALAATGRSCVRSNLPPAVRRELGANLRPAVRRELGASLRSAVRRGLGTNLHASICAPLRPNHRASGSRAIGGALGAHPRGRPVGANRGRVIAHDPGDNLPPLQHPHLEHTPALSQPITLAVQSVTQCQPQRARGIA